MVVYIDLIFLTNLLIDGTVLLATAWMRKLKVKLWRIIVAACIGASYVIVMFVPELTFLSTFAVKLIFSLFMVWCAFGFSSLQHFLRNIGMFYVANFAAAGGIIGLHYFMQSSGEVMNGIWFTHSGGLSFQMKIGSTFVLIVFFLMMMLYQVVFKSAKRREAMTQFMAQVRVVIEDVESTCIGLIDTGNHLYDPLTRTPVMIMEASQWKEQLPEAWLKRIQQFEADQIVAAIGEDEFAWQDRLRIIPYRGVNRGTQFMLALKPDKVIITQGDATTETAKVLIGLDGGKLSSDGSYRAIIHPTLIG